MSNLLLISKESFSAFEKFHAQVGAPLAASSLPANYMGRSDMLTTRRQKIAIIPITGMIGKEPMMEYFGGTSLDLLSARMLLAANDPEVSHIILPVNSGGGYAIVVEQTAQLIRQVAQNKPVIALIQGVSASAAYWLSAAASKIYTDGETARVGSIGVYAAFMEFSKALADGGVIVHEFVTGEYKALGSPYHVPTDNEKAKMQEGVDKLMTVFVDSVAAYRNISKDTVLKSADGQVFFAKDAAERGLTDGQLTLTEVITMTEQETTMKAQLDQLAAMTKSNEEMKAKLEAAEKALADKASAETALAAQVLAESCTTLYQTHMGRVPTDAEKATFTASSPEVRTSLTTALEAISSARDSQANASDITKDVASTGADPKAGTQESSLLLQALARATQK